MLVVLISKKGGVEDSRNFRPISLVGGLYKWLAKDLKSCCPKLFQKLKMILSKDEIFGRSNRS